MSKENIEIWYNIGTDGVSMEFGREPERPGQECWQFECKDIMPLSGDEKDLIRIYYGRTRFKKEVLPFEYSAGRTEYKVQEQRKSCSSYQAAPQAINPVG